MSDFWTFMADYIVGGFVAAGIAVVIYERWIIPARTKATATVKQRITA